MVATAPAPATTTKPAAITTESRQQQDSKANVYQRLVAIYDALEPIAKTGKNNEQGGYAFVEQSHVAAEIRKLLAKYGVVLVSEVLEVETREITSTKNNTRGERALVKMRFSFVNADAPEDKIVFEGWPGLSYDFSDKAVNKALTAAQKTFLIKQFLVSDIDPDSDTPQVAATQPRPAQSQPPRPAGNNNPPPARPAANTNQERPPGQMQAQQSSQANNRPPDPRPVQPAPAQQPSQAQNDEQLPEGAMNKLQFAARIKKIEGRMDQTVAAKVANAFGHENIPALVADVIETDPTTGQDPYRAILRDYIALQRERDQYFNWNWDEAAGEPIQEQDIPFGQVVVPPAPATQAAQRNRPTPIRPSASPAGDPWSELAERVE
jgi:hypothetical protein